MAYGTVPWKKGLNLNVSDWRYVSRKGGGGQIPSIQKCEVYICRCTCNGVGENDLRGRDARVAFVACDRPDGSLSLLGAGNAAHTMQVLPRRSAKLC